MNKKAVFLISSLRGGGAEGVCVNIANRLSGNQWDVTLIVLNLDNAVRANELNQSVNLIDLGKKHARSAFFPLFKLLCRQKFEKILVFDHQLAVILVLIRCFLKNKYHIIARNINTLSAKQKYERSLWHKYIVHYLTVIIYKNVDLVIAQSDGMKDDLINNYGFVNSKIAKINNPINAEIENYLENNKIETGKKRDYLLCIGRLEESKAWHYTIRAFAEIAPDYPGLHIKFVGKGSAENSLKRLASELNVSSRTEFEGYQKKIIPYYLSAKATVLTSLYEGFPNVLVESISLGTPVVSFNCPSGPEEIVQDGINGYLVNYLDTEHLVLCMKKALDRSWDTAAVRVTAGKYSSDFIIEKYMQILS
jgi:glycosyltransferase involved in cell wall biosynthesis